MLVRELAETWRCTASKFACKGLAMLTLPRESTSVASVTPARRPRGQDIFKHPHLPPSCSSADLRCLAVWGVSDRSTRCRHRAGLVDPVQTPTSRHRAAATAQALAATTLSMPKPLLRGRSTVSLSHLLSAFAFTVPLALLPPPPTPPPPPPPPFTVPSTLHFESQCAGKAW